MRKALFVSSLVMLILASAAPARAQFYFAPFIGYDFGGDAGQCPSLFTDCTEKKGGYGVTIGVLAGGVFGIEEDIGYAPDFFGQSASYGDNSVLSAMTNLVVGIPIKGFRPFASGGVGLMRTHVPLGLTTPAGTQSDNTWAYDIGGGVMFFFPHHLGFRADYRYFKSLQALSILGFEVENPKLSFSRVSVALILH